MLWMRIDSRASLPFCEVQPVRPFFRNKGTILTRQPVLYLQSLSKGVMTACGSDLRTCTFLPTSRMLRNNLIKAIQRSIKSQTQVWNSFLINIFSITDFYVQKDATLKEAFLCQKFTPVRLLQSTVLIVYYIMESTTIEKIDLRPGNYYQIIHYMTGKALMMVEQKSNEYKDRSPVLGEPNDTNLNQVWMIEYIRQRKLYEIVHALSTLVIQSTPRSVKLVFGNWGQGQHYNIKMVQNAKQPNTFHIKDKDNDHVFLYADVRDGMVQLGQKDEFAQQTRWVLKIAEKTRAITQSVLFQNAFTNMTIDVPEASSKRGVKLIQYPINKRFNQRFRLDFHQQTNTYHIENVKSKLVVDIKDQNEKQGGSIIQWERNSGLNQQWYLQNQGKDLYLIRSAMKPQLFIGIKNNEFKQAAELVTTKREDFALWRILGQFQRQQYTLV